MKNINITVSVFTSMLVAINVAHAASLNSSHNDLSKRPYTQSSTNDAEQKNHKFEGAVLIRNNLETDADLNHKKQYSLLRTNQLARRPY